MLTEKTGKNRKCYLCEVCQFNTSDKKDYSRHCSTRKHSELTKLLTEKTDEVLSHHICSHCGKEYNSRVGLWKHSKTCLTGKNDKSIISEDDILGSEPIKNYIMSLVAQNTELKNMFIQHNAELKEIKTIIAEQPPRQITNNKNITNNQFNLNVFLQQTCKDAMNMSDFIDSLDINNKTLERIGTHGYVHGISKIFIDGIKKLEVHERPIHCSDLKREVMYIKDNNTWTKDDDNKLFNKALEGVVHRNMVQLLKWEEENPETSNPESKNYEFYFVLARQSTGGGNQDVTDRNNDKILKAIAKEVHIDRKVKELL